MFERARAAGPALRDEKERAAGRADHVVTVQACALSLASLKAVVQVSLIELDADPLLDRAAAEFDRSGFQDAMSKGCATLIHCDNLSDKS